MKKITIIFIPVIVVLVIVGGVLVWRMLNPRVVPQTVNSFPNSIGNEKTNAPKNTLGGLEGTKAVAPAASSAEDLNNELKNTVDDGGKADLDAITAEAGGL